MDNKNKMLVDATHPEETRVVVLRNGRVEEFDYESANRKLLRGNIYLAKVTRVEPSLQAAFVEYGGNRHGFLAFSEIHPDYYQIPVADRRALIEAEEMERASQDDDDEDEETEAVSQRRGRSRRRRRGGRTGSRRRDEGGRETALDARDDNDGDAPADRQAAPLATAADPYLAEQPPTEDLRFPSEGIVDLQTPELAATTPETTAPASFADSTAEPGAASEPADEREADADDRSVETETASDREAEVYATASEHPDDDVEPIHARRGEEADNDDEDDDNEDDDVSDDEEDDDVEQVGSEDALEEVPVRRPRRLRSYKIQEVIKRRQVILVQVVKEERGSKGAALTTYLSLAGRYTVLMPNTGRGGGISRKITNASDRRRLKQIAQSLEVPEGMGLIVRTAGAARSDQEIRRDYDYLLRLWENIRELTLASTAPSLVYEEGNLIKRSIRDHYSKDVEEIVVAGAKAHGEAQEFMRMLMPGHAKNVTLYEGRIPLLTRFHVERQLNAMFSPLVTLRSGGYIVINQTEALVAVDVNSGKATREYSIEETALNTNLEAAEEIARQLKLRDLAGLIVIDFIDMEEKRNNRAVERRMKDCLREDRARIQVGRISHFGLLEMSRQRMRTGVLEGSTTQCPHCLGTGIVRSTESVALAVLRGLEDECVKGDPVNLSAVTTPDVALYILNNKRTYIADMETRYGVAIAVEVSERMQGANFAIERTAQAAAQSRTPVRTAINMESGFIEPEADVEVENGGGEDEQEGSRRSRGRGRRRRSRGGRSDNEARTGSETIDDETPDIDDEDGEPETVRDLEVSADHDRSDDEGADDDEQGEPRKRRRRRRGRRGGQRNREAARNGDDERADDAASESDDASGETGGRDNDAPAVHAERPSTDVEPDTDQPPTEPLALAEPLTPVTPRPEERSATRDRAAAIPVIPSVAALTPQAGEATRAPNAPEARTNGADHRPDEALAQQPITPEEEADSAAKESAPAESEASSRPARRGWWQRRLLGGD